MLPRLVPGLAAAALAVGALAGCTGDPEPEPTAPFATEEEAFAAAEEVYRAYTDALNAERAGDISAAPRDFLTGTALELEKDAYQTLDAMNVHVVGATRVTSVSPVSADVISTPPTIQANICTDVSNVRLRDQDGDDVTPDERPDVSGLLVTFVAIDGRLLISNSQVPEDAKC